MNPALAGLCFCRWVTHASPSSQPHIRRDDEDDKNLAGPQGSFSIRAIGSLAHYHSS